MGTCGPLFPLGGVFPAPSVPWAFCWSAVFYIKKPVWFWKLEQSVGFLICSNKGGGGVFPRGGGGSPRHRHTRIAKRIDIIFLMTDYFSA